VGSCSVGGRAGHIVAEKATTGSTSMLISRPMVASSMSLVAIATGCASGVVCSGGPRVGVAMARVTGIHGRISLVQHAAIVRASSGSMMASGRMSGEPTSGAGVGVAVACIRRRIGVDTRVELVRDSGVVWAIVGTVVCVRVASVHGGVNLVQRIAVVGGSSSSGVASG